jgi:glycine/D-amino acid oxidase-like deaminating enzyme
MEMLDRNSMRTIAPYLALDCLGGAICPIEGKANPLKATPAFANAARKYGAEIWTNTRVTSLERRGGLFHATTTRGPIISRRVVNAAGAAATEITQMLGVTIALEGFPLQVTVTEPVAPLIPHLVYSAAGKLSAKQGLNGTCLIGGGWPARRRSDGSLVIDPASLTGNMRNAASIIPALGHVRAVRSWTATVNGTPDWRPIIGEVSAEPGFFLSLFPWMGFSAGPMTARLTADLVLGRKPRLPLEGISALYD